MRTDVEDLFRGLGLPGFVYREWAPNTPRAARVADGVRSLPILPEPAACPRTSTFACVSLSQGSEALLVAAGLASSFAENGGRALVLEAEGDRLAKLVEARSQFELAWPVRPIDAARIHEALAGTSGLAGLRWTPPPLDREAAVLDQLLPSGWTAVVAAGPLACAHLTLGVISARDLAWEGGVQEAARAFVEGAPSRRCVVVLGFDPTERQQREAMGPLRDALGPALVGPWIHADAWLEDAVSQGRALAPAAPLAQAHDDLRRLASAIRQRAQPATAA